MPIDALDTKIPGALQLGLYAGLQELLLDRIVWMLRHGALGEGLTRVVRRFGDAVSTITGTLERVLPAHDVADLSQRRAELERQGVPHELARRLVELPVVAEALDVELVAEATRRPIDEAAAAYFRVTDAFGIGALSARAKGLSVTGYYDRLALNRALADLFGASRRIATAALKNGGHSPSELAAQIGRTPTQIDRWIAGRDLVNPEMQDRICTWLKRGRTELFSREPIGEILQGKMRWATGLARAMDSADNAMDEETLAALLGKNPEIVQAWKELRLQEEVVTRQRDAPTLNAASSSATEVCSSPAAAERTTYGRRRTA
jgi:hypothetical protein